MHALLIIGLVFYGVMGLIWGYGQTMDIIALLRRARHPSGPAVDYMCIVGAGIGVFVFIFILWPVAIFLSPSVSSHLSLNENRVVKTR